MLETANFSRAQCARDCRNLVVDLSLTESIAVSDAPTPGCQRGAADCGNVAKLPELLRKSDAASDRDATTRR
jgi:hypothetical protein